MNGWNYLAEGSTSHEAANIGSKTCKLAGISGLSSVDMIERCYYSSEGIYMQYSIIDDRLTVFANGCFKWGNFSTLLIL